MTLDLRSVPVQVVVGGLDLSPAFVSLSIIGNALDDSGWYKPRGQLVLGANVDGIAEDMDCRTNPGRWAPGTIVAASVWLGSWVPLPWRLRILSYPNRPSPGNNTITLEVGTDADLLNYRAPEGDPGTDEYGTPTGATFLINRALTQAGAPSLSDSITTLNLPFSPEKKTGGSWITYAGATAYAARHILWQQTDGAIRATPLTLDGLTPTASYTVGTDDADYVLSAPGEQPPEIVQAQGTTYLIEDATPDDSVVEETINGVLTRTEVRYDDWATLTPEIVETVSIPLNLMSPGKFPGISALYPYRRTTTRKTYDAWDRLVEEFTQVKQPSFLTPFAAQTTALIVVGETVTTYEFPTVFSSDADDLKRLKTAQVMTRKVTVERALYRIDGAPLSLKDRTVTTETWEKKGPELYLHRVNVRDDSPDPTALPPRNQPSQFSPPPATTFRPAAKQRTEIPYSGKATFTNAVGSGFAEKLWSINLPSGMGVSASQCRAHAALWGKIRQGRQFGIRWGGDLAAAWLTNFSPVARVDITDRGTTTAYLVEGFTLEIDQRSAALGGMGLELGQVSGAVLEPPYIFVPEAYHAAVVGGLAFSAVIESTVEVSHAAVVGGLTFAVQIGEMPAEVTHAANVGGLVMAASADPVLEAAVTAAVGGLTFAASVNDSNVAIHAVAIGGLTMTASVAPVVDATHSANVGGLVMAASGGPVIEATHAASVGGVVMAASIGPAASDPILTTASLHTYYNADFGVLQSTGGAASGTGDPVGFWESQGSAGLDATQGTSTARPTLSSVNSLPSLSFDGGDFYTAGSIGDWNFLHNTTGFTVVLVFAKAAANPGTLQLLVDTLAASSANRGLSIFYDDRASVPANDRLRVLIGRGVSGSPLQDRQSADNVLDGTTPHIIVVRFDGVSTLNARVDGVTVINATSNNSGSPSGSNSTFTLNIGRSGGNAFYASGQIPLVALFDNDLSLGDVEAIETHWMAQYGIT